MTVIRVEKVNEVHLRCYCDDMGVESELSAFFTFEVPGAKFTPLYRNGLWDGKKRLFDSVRKTLYAGLLPYLQKFCENNEYTLEYLNECESANDYTLEEVQTFCDSLLLHSNGEELTYDDYQVSATHLALNDKRCVLKSPTGSGKSAIIYALTRWHLRENRRVLIVCPTTTLVEQMLSDFRDYSVLNKWDADSHCKVVYSGFDKHLETDVTISTWQSIYKLDKKWFSQFDVIIGDEAHQYKSQSLVSIMEKLTHIEHRIGTTGTIDDKKVHRLVLEGIFGKIHTVTTTSILQSNGRLAALDIKAIILKHPDDTKKAIANRKPKITYQEEIDYLIKNTTRNKFISNLSISCKTNILILFQFVENHGKVLYDMIKEKVPDRPVYFIHGGVKTEERERIRSVLKEQNNAIVVASYQTVSTGWNAPSIENVIFASPSKSTIRVLQSIGRGLRLSENKTGCTLYDLTDDMHWKKKKNFTLLHGADRYKIYAQEGFNDINLIEVNLHG